MQRIKEEKKNIKENIKWFKRFSLEKRFELSSLQAKAIKLLKGLAPKKHAAPH